MVFLGFAFSCALACAGQIAAEPNPPLPVSLERIQERLKRPDPLQLPPERKPDFRATVSEEFERPETILEALRRELGGDVTPKPRIPGTISPALVSVDLLQIATSIKRRMSAALRARAERNARAEVAAVLAEFCAQHDCSALEESGQSTSEGVLTR
jgi:hypothetical protein